MKESLIKTAIATVINVISKTLTTVAKKTYSGSLPPFIRNCLSCSSSDDTAKATELLAQILLVEQFITQVAEDRYNFEDCMTLGGAKILVEEVLKACTSEQWATFHLSKFPLG